MAEAELAEARGALAAYLNDGGGGARLEVRAADALLTMPAALSNQEPSAARASTDAQTSASTPTERALSSRGEVRAARERLASATAGVAAEQRMFIRQLGATLGMKQMAGSTSMIAGFSLPIPVFDANRGEVQRASAERDAAAFEVANQERVTSSELLGAYEAARVLTTRANLLTHGGTDSFLARADEARRIALGAYREGAVPLFQVIDAARTWGDARVTYYRLLYAQHQSVLALLAAQGTDLFDASSTITLSVPAR
jgi:Outer membrane protein